MIRFADDIAWRNLWPETRADDRRHRSREHLLEAIRARSRADESIFVWGYYPELYVLAPREPASRYSNTNYLTGLLPWENDQPGVDTSAHIVPGGRELVLAELAESRPKLVVDTSLGNHRAYAKYPLESFPGLVQFLSAHYQREAIVDDHRGRPIAGLWVRRDG